MRLLSLLLAIFVFPLAAYYKIEVGQGYQEGSLDWNIAGPVVNKKVTPDVLSELKWQDLSLWNTHATAAYYEIGYRVKIEGNYGKIYKGTVRDQDFGGNGRTRIFSDAQATADRGEVYDYNLTAGYPLCWKGFTFVPYGGMGYDVQSVTMTSPATLDFNGQNNPFNPTSTKFKTKIDDLDSSYKAVWKGPLLGFDLGYRWAFLAIFSSIEYHWLEFKGKAHWNLRDDILGPFHHSGEGNGIKWKAGGSVDLNGQWTLSVLSVYTSYSLRHGIEKSTIVWNKEPLFIKTGLNDVNWHAWTITLNVGYKF